MVVWSSLTRKRERTVWVETPTPPVFGKENGQRSPTWTDVLLWGVVGFLLSTNKEYGRLEIRAAVITVSDKGYAGQRQDLSGPALAEALVAMGATVVARTIVPDEEAQIERAMIEYADNLKVDLIMSTGGTGAAPRDRTPDATRRVIDREMPGLAELLRWQGYQKTPLAVLTRGIAGLRGQCLIVNLPGSPKAVREGMETLALVLPHAIQMMRGENLEHGAAPHA